MGAVYFPGELLTFGIPRMQAPIIDDELWTLIEPLLPSPKPRRNKYPGRLPVSDRAALNGILFVFRTGLRWNHLPTNLGFGSGATCWRRLRDWHEAGVWDRLHELLLANLREADQLIFPALLWTRRRCELLGRAKTGPNPVDRARPGSKYHILVDANGAPVSVILRGANRNDVAPLLPRVDAIPPIRGARGWPLRKPEIIYADRGFDSEPIDRRFATSASSP